MQLKYYIIFASLIIVIYIVWIFFHTRAVAKRKRELLAEELECKQNRVNPPKLKPTKKKKEIYYKLHTDPVKLNLYQKSYFGNYKIGKIYQKIVIDTYWLDEPFHTEFSKILQFIGSNNFWIKDPKSREIIMNVRDKMDKINKQISMNVLALNEVLEQVVIEVYSNLKNKNIHNRYEMQNSILSVVIYVLLECGEIEFICKILGITYKDNDSLVYDLIDRIYKNLTYKTKNIIAQDNFINSVDFRRVLDEVLHNTTQYPYTFSRDEPKASIIKLLGNKQKKQLISI